MGTPNLSHHQRSNSNSSNNSSPDWEVVQGRSKQQPQQQQQQDARSAQKQITTQRYVQATQSQDLPVRYVTLCFYQQTNTINIYIYIY